jgi:hypothetical protein
MTGPDGKVRLCQLFERRAASGKRYLTGRLGGAKIVALLDDRAGLKFGAVAAFTVFLEPGEDRPRPAGDEAGTRNLSLPLGKEGDESPRQERGERAPKVQRLPPPERASDEPPAEPLPDDGVADLWRGQE